MITCIGMVHVLLIVNLRLEQVLILKRISVISTVTQVNTSIGMDPVQLNVDSLLEKEKKLTDCSVNILALMTNISLLMAHVVLNVLILTQIEPKEANGSVIYHVTQPIGLIGTEHAHQFVQCHSKKSL